jgi:hypothetical protein
MKTAPYTWDVLVVLTKIGGISGESRFGGVPINKVIRGFLTQESLDLNLGLPAIGQRMETTDGTFSSSEVQSVTRDSQKENIYIVETRSGRYELRFVRKRKLKNRI